MDAMSGYGASLRWANVGERVSHSRHLHSGPWLGSAGSGATSRCICRLARGGTGMRLAGTETLRLHIGTQRGREVPVDRLTQQSRFRIAAWNGLGALIHSTLGPYVSVAVALRRTFTSPHRRGPLAPKDGRMRARLPAAELDIRGDLWNPCCIASELCVRSTTRRCAASMSAGRE
jgi:hypothetical protein